MARIITSSSISRAAGTMPAAMMADTASAATSIEELKTFRLGAAANTTSFTFLEDTIAPTVEPSVFQDNAATLLALQGDVVDGIIVDLSTAFFMRDAQLEDFDTLDPEGTIVGQFGPPAEPDHVGFVQEQGNPLVDCVNQAIAEIKASGEHQTLLVSPGARCLEELPLQVGGHRLRSGCPLQGCGEPDAGVQLAGDSVECVPFGG